MQRMSGTSHSGPGVLIIREGREIGFVPTGTELEAQAAVLLIGENPIYRDLEVSLKIVRA